MTTPAGGPPVTDPMKGVRGVFAALLVLESIVVLLALLLPGIEGASAGIITALAGLMIVASGLQRRPWGLGLALVLQVATIACGLLAPSLGIIGVVFALVWGYVLYLRRDVAAKMARGELPSQQAREP